MLKILLLLLLSVDISKFICWDENRKLSIADFRRVDFLEWSHDHDGETLSQIVVQRSREDSILKYSVYNCFDPDSSWMRFCDTTKNIYTPEFIAEIEEKQKTTGINHEQKHFDLNEVYARKIRRMFQLHCTWNTYKNLTDSIGAYLDECEKQQNLYDKETLHSIDKVMQRKWDLKIKRMLDELNNYKEPEGEVILR